MKRGVMWVILLGISIAVMAQTTPSSTNLQNSTMAVTPPVVAGPNGLSTNTGTAVIIAPPSAPLLVTPEVHLTTVVPPAGAVSATPGNTAGAANTTTSIPVSPTIVTTVPQYSIAGSTITQTIPPETTSGTASSVTPLAGGPVVVVNNQPVPLNLGVGSANLLVGGNTAGKSLGEIAREYRQSEATANAHVYTNQDIQRLNQQPGVTIGGMTGAAVGAGAATQQPPSGNMPVVSQPQPATNPPSYPGVSQPVAPAQNPPQSQANPPARMRGQQEMAQTSAPGNPAEQNEAAPAAAPSRNSKRTLPSGSSILPLIAVVGVLATGAGLLSR